MKKLKFVILIIVICIVGVFIYFGYNYYLDNKEKVLLQGEVENVLKYINKDEVNLEKIKEIMKPVITTDKRLAVEEALEEYITVSATAIDTTINLLNDERLTNLLSASNFASDGPEFKVSKAYIKETKEKLQQNKEEILSLTKTSKILNFFTNSSNDKYYEEMYKDLAIGSGLSDNDINNFSDSIDTIINLLDISNEALDFLSKNRMAWQIQEEQIYFTNEALLNEYNSIVAKIK